jgi:hypothetical protein
MKVQLEINKTTHVNLYGVSSFYVCNCELHIVFRRDHTYESINDIENVLRYIGIPIGNFYFNGLSAWDFDEDNWGKLIPRKEYPENGDTSVLCMIPEAIRDGFSVTAYEY